MTNDFLGKGWALPIGLDDIVLVEDGQTIRLRPIKLVEHEEAIWQSIWMILGTAPGERVMRPEFGCGIHDLVYAVNSAGTAGRIAHEIRQALLRWEPRIEVLDVTADSDTTQPNKLLIKIEYRVRTTNNRFNLVYPFYLE